jgi:hypothetical protein
LARRAPAVNCGKGLLQPVHTAVSGALAGVLRISTEAGDNFVDKRIAERMPTAATLMLRRFA